MDLTPLSSFWVKSQADCVKIISNSHDLREGRRACAHSPIYILGGGTNTIWGCPVIERIIIKIEIPGIKIINRSGNHVLVQVGAGESWDKVVKFAMEEGLSGIEALSGIPGTTGAGPIQNIGAYGQEIGDVIESVSVFDWNTGEESVLSKIDCRFSYRDSVFKQKRNLIITKIILKLSKETPLAPNYPDTLKYFGNNRRPTLEEIRSAILEIRTKKLPDLQKIPNCGSFFKNPLVNPEVAQEILETHPDLPQFPGEKGVKIPAGWLIDKVGLKGQQLGPIQVYSNNALVLTNPLKDASPEDVKRARDKILETVFSEFGITLEMEPDLIT